MMTGESQNFFFLLKRARFLLKIPSRSPVITVVLKFPAR